MTEDTSDRRSDLTGTRDTSDLYQNLLAAMAGAKALAKRRPDLKFICADIVANATLQMRDPDDPDYRRAGNLLAQQITRRVRA